MTYAASSSDNRERARAEREKRRRTTRAPDLAPYRADCALFIAECILIDNAQPGTDDAAAVMPFVLWEAQRDLLGAMVTERLLLILKARQLGISWLVCAYALWLCLFHPGRLVLKFSIGQAESDEMLRRVSVMYWRLSPELRAALPKLAKENTSSIGWANESRIESLPTTQKAGSGYTASLVILDEFAKNAWDEKLYTAVKPTIDGGGAMIVLSSAYGIDNLFFDLCQKAMRDEGRFTFRFLPWWARPDRDAAWYAATELDAVSSALMGQEYPATPDEAFAATGAERFLPSIVWWDACLEPDLAPLTPYEPLVLALDAGEVSDTFAAVAVGRHPTRYEDSCVRYARVWDPKIKPINFQEIEDELRAFIGQWNVVQLCFDRYQLRQMTQRLSDVVWCEEFSQAGDRLVADKYLLDTIQNRHTAHDGTHRELREHLDNADRKVESQERLRIVKRSGNRKIDLAVAMSMSNYRMMTEFQ